MTECLWDTNAPPIAVLQFVEKAKVGVMFKVLNFDNTNTVSVVDL